MLLKNSQVEITALSDFIDSKGDPRELKRALAVQMVIQKYSYFEIRDLLQVSVGFISKYKQLFKQQGVRGLTLKHQGSNGYLDKNTRLEVNEWLQQKNDWNLAELKQHLLDNYGVVFASSQSYYVKLSGGILPRKTLRIV